MVKTHHIPGQLPLFLPESKWKSPSELPDLRGKVREIALDTETNDFSLSAGRGPGWATKNVRIAGMSAAWEGGAFYAPTAHPDSENFDPDQLVRWIKDHDEAGITFLFHNVHYDCGTLLACWESKLPKSLGDTIAMAVMVDENLPSYSLEYVSKWCGIPGKDERVLQEAAAAYGFENAVKSNLYKLPARFVGPYAEQDAIATLNIARILRRKLEEEQTYQAYQIEMDLVPLIIEMRRKGIRVDLEKAETARLDLTLRRDDALKELSQYLGQNVSMGEVNSARHLEVWFQNAKIPFRRTAKSKQGQFDIDWMEKHEHWLPKQITLIRQLEMAQSKFLKGFIIDYASNGRIHASINQFRNEDGGTRSHRMSYSDPPLQQMYGRGKTELKDHLVDIIRGCFLPEEGQIWGAIDFSQQEYRLIVHFAELLKCNKAKEAGDRYRTDPSTDFHDLVASLTGLGRSRAKDVNFAKAFGAGVSKFAVMTGMSPEEAKAVMGQYDTEMPFVKEASDLCKRAAERRGYIRLIDGARSHFDFWEPAYRNWDEEAKFKGGDCSPCYLDEAERRIQNDYHPWEGRLVRAYTHKALNRLIQGSAARQTKMAMLLCWQEGIVPCIQMHDELGFSLQNKAQGDRAAELMRDAIKLTVPMKTDAEYGISWGTARKIETKQKKVLYDASWDSAIRLRDEGRWW